MLGLGVAAATAVGATVAGYQSIAPTGQLFGKAFCGSRPASKLLALTFDDGPNDPHTLSLLDILSKHGVRATFFLIGQYVRQRPETVAEVARRGHVVGNHTFTHPVLTVQPASRIRSEIVDCRKAIADAIGEHSNLFRPPFGARRPGVFRLVRELGLEPVMWNVTGHDWNAPSSDYIVQKVMPKIRGGNVFLLHDGGHAGLGADRSKTVQAVDQLIVFCKERNLEFVTIPQMMGQANTQH